jgi:hypothetical protein
MLSEQEALAKVKAFMPGAVPEKIVTYNNLYLVLAPRPNDPVEGDWDPYFSVDMETGVARDYSLFQDGKAREIASLFEIAPKIT